jgi:hypothetical protein
VATTAGTTSRWRVSEGEEARLTPGAAFAAEIRSRGALPLRARRAALHHARPAFAGTAVVLGQQPYEVVAEEEPDETGAVVYRLREWPEGEVFRDRVVYGPALVRSVENERKEARLRARARPWRFLLYPLVGLLPEAMQARACERLGLYAVTATLVSGLVESGLVMTFLLLLGREADPGKAVLIVVTAPGLFFFVLPGLGRAAGALLLHETAGSPVVAGVVTALRSLGALPAPDTGGGFVPLTRVEFWRRLDQPDRLEPQPDGALLLLGVLPHLGWDRSRRLEAPPDFWQVEPRLPERVGDRLVYRYRLVPLGDPPEPGQAGPTAPEPTAYADEVWGGIRLEWDAFNSGFAWLSSLLGADVQARAFAHHGGAPAARRPTLATAAAGAALGGYLLHFLPGPPGDPLAPAIAVLGLLLLADGAQRFRAARAGRYAPSLLRFLLPSNVLRPERLAFQAHRDAEQDALGVLRQG